MKNELNNKRLAILNVAKKHLKNEGWNDNIFKIISKSSKFKEEEIIALFQNGYKSLLELYLSNADIEMTKACKQLKLIRMKTHERIKAIILLRLKINEKEKKLVKKTFQALILPRNSKIAVLSLYKTVNQIWFLAGDNSTDFNFYTKRAILSAIYSTTVLYWIKDQRTLEQTNIFLSNQLFKLKKIPDVKEKTKLLFKIVPKMFLYVKKM